MRIYIRDWLLFSIRWSFWAVKRIAFLFQYLLENLSKTMLEADDYSPTAIVLKPGVVFSLCPLSPPPPPRQPPPHPLAREIFGNDWGHFWLLQLEGCGLLAFSEYRSHLWLNIPQCTGQFHTKRNYLVQPANSAGMCISENMTGIAHEHCLSWCPWDGHYWERRPT